MSELTIYNEAQELQTTGMNLEQLIKLFLSSSYVKESSRNQYSRTIKQYLKWVASSKLDIKDIARVNILQYIEDLLSSATINSYLTAVKKFYEFVESIKLYANVAKGIKGTKCKKQFRKHAPSETQGKNLFTRLQEGDSLRDSAVVNLLLRTGLRTIEVDRANVEDITYKSGKRVLLVHGKGRDEKDNFVMITDKTMESITKCLDSRGKIKAGDALFTCTSNNNKGGWLTTRTISKIAKENLKGIGLNSK